MADATTIRNFTIKSLQQFYEKLDLDTKLADYVTKDDLSEEGFLSSETDPTVPSYVKLITQANINSWNNKVATESDPVFSASAAAGITSENITSWNDKVSNVQSDWNATSGLAQILNKPDLSDYFDDVEYDKTNKLINFKHNNVVKDTLDATDFIKDGMVDTAYLGKGTTTGKENKDCLIIRFNTDAGKEDIEILLADIFNPENYYDMSSADNLFATFETLNSYVSKTELSAQSYVTTTALNTRLNTAGYISSIPSEYVTDTELSAKGYLTSFTETDPTVPSYVKLITQANITAWNSYANVQADWNATSGDAMILNKPDIVTDEYGWINIGTNTSRALINAASIEISDGKNSISLDAGGDNGIRIIANDGTDGDITLDASSDIFLKTSETNKAYYNNKEIATKDDIPAAVTESTVSGWGFTKTAGTITGITMNGASKGTSGVVDLGTVITSETQPDWNVTNTSSAAYILNKPDIPVYSVTQSKANYILATNPGLNGLSIGRSTTQNITFQDDDNITIHSGNTGKLYFNNKEVAFTSDIPSTADLISQTSLSAQSYVTTTDLNTRLNNAGYISFIPSEYITQAELSANGYLTSFTEEDPTVPSYVKLITQANINAWNSYANVQADWNATSGDAYIKNKPTIPTAVTESTVSGWGFTKNAGTLTGVKFNNTNATINGTVAEITATIPAAVTESTVSGWGFTKNVGTITGITMNGASKGTSGVVDLGTVITSETQSDWNATSGAAYIKNKPTIPSISGLATETYVNEKVAGIVNSAPETLDTLNELAAALGNDANFSTTIATQIGEKVSKTELSAQGYLTSFTESDPTVPNYVKSITQTNINNWNSYANVQADWNATSGDAYIKNKPTIPSIAGLVSQTTLSSQSYVTSTALNTRLSNAGYISSIPSEYITQAELSSNGYLTSQTKANWTETNSNSAAYIQNKPTIPAAANNSTITIQKGGTNVDTFTTNAASNKTINIPNELPTYSSSDSGKVLSVNSSGQLVWITPVSIYTGSGEPSNSMGNDGDIYLQQ